MMFLCLTFQKPSESSQDSKDGTAAVDPEMKKEECKQNIRKAEVSPFHDHFYALTYDLKKKAISKF